MIMADFARKRNADEHVSGIPMQNSSANYEITPRVPYKRRSDRLANDLPAVSGTGTAVMGRIIAPQVRLVNGKVVLDNQATLMVDASSTQSQASTQLQVVHEVSSAHSRHFTSATHSRYSGANRWTPTATELFYTALGMCGTDFERIACLFPGKSRAQIKNKFKVEERTNPAMINRILMAKPVPFDASAFQNTGNKWQLSLAGIYIHRDVQKRLEIICRFEHPLDIAMHA